MQRRTCKKMSLVLTALCLMVAFGVCQALAWGSATHAYIGSKLVKKPASASLQVIYGAMVPDCFNFRFDLPEDLYYLTHEDSLDLWDAADAPPFNTSPLKALGFGFVSHNDDFGADSTAHHEGRTYGLGEGYVTAKAYDLLIDNPLLLIYVDGDTALELCHNFVEFGVDLLVRGLDRRIGKRMSEAALERDADFPDLLLEAYDFSALGVSEAEVRNAEGQFRSLMVAYGQALQQRGDGAVAALASQIADLALDYLEDKGISFPESLIVPIITFYLGKAMDLCQPDFAGEIAATITFVQGELDDHDVVYTQGKGNKRPNKSF